MGKQDKAQRSHRAADRAQLRGIAVATLLYIVAAAGLALSQGNHEFLYYIVVMGVLICAIYCIHRRVGLSAGLLWCLSGWGLMHMAGGLLVVPESWPTSSDGKPVLYNLWLVPGWIKYDQATHAYGFGITTWLCWQALSASAAVRPTFGIMTLCAAAGMGFGALNEVVEFAATLTMPETNVGGYQNTGWDLVANLVGCTAAAAIIAWRVGRDDRPSR